MALAALRAMCLVIWGITGGVGSQGGRGRREEMHRLSIEGLRIIKGWVVM